MEKNAKRKVKVNRREIEYEVRSIKINTEPDDNGKKGLVPGRLLGTIKVNGMVSPGTSIELDGERHRVRCVDLLPNKRIILVE
jgi:hypothetical protein